ncbi:MAG: DUF4864 domain-containing protein [Verrucomicrobia bacterium]|jgi:hypothetical protein|nr:DUF4864 domain-containing protein [Verrucomicrobiota bacterium]
MKSIALLLSLVLAYVSLAFFLRGGSNTGAFQSGEDERLTAEAVVRKQLEGLQNNDSPSTDAGIELAWEYAHPANREATGPLPRFTEMLKSPAYRDLLDHSAHQINRIASTETTATFNVLVFPAGNNAPLRYRWTVARLPSGDWATTAVSAPVEAGLPPA